MRETALVIIPAQAITRFRKGFWASAPHLESAQPDFRGESPMKSSAETGIQADPWIPAFP